MENPFDNYGIRGVAVLIEHPDRHDPDILRGILRDNPRYMGPVAEEVMWLVIILHGVIRGNDPVLKPGVRNIDPGINDSYGYCAGTAFNQLPQTVQAN